MRDIGVTGVQTCALPIWSASFLDGAVDGAVAAFALWTAIYLAALAGRWSLWTPALIWVVLALVLVVAFGVLEARGAEGARRAPADVDTGAFDEPVTRPAVIALGVAALAVTVALREWIGSWPTVVP